MSDYIPYHIKEPQITICARRILELAKHGALSADLIAQSMFYSIALDAEKILGEMTTWEYFTQSKVQPETNHPGGE